MRIQATGGIPHDEFWRQGGFTQMHVLNINIGSARIIGNAKASPKTGIYKLPVAGPVHVTAGGLPGDAICSVKHHGGPDQAVYVYGGADYAWWAAVLGQALAPGTFGENLTISDLESAGLAIGDRLHVGAVILEVTAPRIPCGTFAQRMGDPGFVERFRAAERPGFYCRVVREGVIQAGQPVTLEPYAGKPVTIIEVFRDYYEPELTPAAIRRFLAAPLAIRTHKKKKEQQLHGGKHG
ncbi:MAG: MOSC domain-containing protein [Chloroflexi bacterium]|nr:MOSC domain-containing protein [Chloroflexota bacterium]